MGEDLRFWQHIYRWCLDLLARGKFLPGFRRKNGTYGGIWQVLLDSNSDRERLAKFIQQMPEVNRSYHGKNQGLESSETQSLILSFLKQILDVQVRRWIETGIQINASDAVQTWLQSLSVPSEFEADSNQVRRLETALNNWYLPIDESLIGADSQLGQNLFCTCFVLHPPTESELKQGNGDWTLEYYLQAFR
ncbi:MAG: hypothetical protein HC890_15035 [Chloroflexaceae bacterium]|nr:hypothetical protein [Chloroflexaceae bacterium]